MYIARLMLKIIIIIILKAKFYNFLCLDFIVLVVWSYKCYSYLVMKTVSKERLLLNFQAVTASGQCEASHMTVICKFCAMVLA